MTKKLFAVAVVLAAVSAASAYTVGPQAVTKTDQQGLEFVLSAVSRDNLVEVEFEMPHRGGLRTLCAVELVVAEGTNLLISVPFLSSSQRPAGNPDHWKTKGAFTIRSNQLANAELVLLCGGTFERKPAAGRIRKAGAGSNEWQVVTAYSFRSGQSREYRVDVQSFLGTKPRKKERSRYKKRLPDGFPGEGALGSGHGKQEERTVHHERSAALVGDGVPERRGGHPESRQAGGARGDFLPGIHGESDMYPDSRKLDNGSLPESARGLLAGDKVAGNSSDGR